MDAVRETFLCKAAPPFSAREQAGSYMAKLVGIDSLYAKKVQMHGWLLLRAGHYCRRLEGAAGWVLQRLQAGLRASAPQQDRHQAQQLCSLFLTDPDMLDVLLALHDIRAAQLRSACPPLILRLGRVTETCSKWDVPTASMAQFCKDSLHVDGTVRFINPAIADFFAWDSLCIITDILLAVVQSIPHKAQPSSPASLQVTASQPSSSTWSTNPSQLAPGFVRCTAALNLNLRLAAAQAVQARHDLPCHRANMSMVHTVLGSWLRGLCVAQTVLLAARHSQWEQQRAEAVSSLLILVQGLSTDLDVWPVNHDDLKPLYSAKGVSTWHPGLWLRNLASSPITTGWPGQLPAAKRQSTRTQLDLRVWNSYAHICHALTTLALQQPHPLEGMKLFTNHPPEQPEALAHRYIECVGAAAAMLAREDRSLERLSEALRAPAQRPSLSRASSTPPAPARRCACGYCQDPRCPRNCLAALAPAMLPVLHRAVTVASGSAVLLRLTLLASSRQEPDIALGLATQVCIKKLCDVCGQCCQLLAALHAEKVEGPGSLGMCRLNLQNTVAAAHCLVSFMQLASPLAMKGVVPGVSWPTHMVTPPHLGSFVGENWGRLPESVYMISAKTSEMCTATNRLVAHCPLDVLQATELVLQGLEGVCAQSARDTSPSALVEREVLLAWCWAPLRLLVLSVQLLHDRGLVGPAGLEARPAAWLPPGQQLIRSWCFRLALRACQVADLLQLASSTTAEVVMCSGPTDVSQLLRHPPMQPDTQRALALVVTTLGVAVPLLAVPKLVVEAACGNSVLAMALIGLCDHLAKVPQQHVHKWRADVAGTCGEPLFAKAMDAVAAKLQLPHLTAAAAEGGEAAAEAVARMGAEQDLQAQQGLVKLVTHLNLCFGCSRRAR
ncbi:hypothetical protein QJQ45_016501 [Haematococcus lacustris]|nr:hypothetical protein QJQ45_016501 [Haematococcus lacustris]